MQNVFQLAFDTRTHQYTRSHWHSESELSRNLVDDCHTDNNWIRSKLIGDNVFGNPICNSSPLTIGHPPYSSLTQNICSFEIYLDIVGYFQ